MSEQAGGSGVAPVRVGAWVAAGLVVALVAIGLGLLVAGKRRAVAEEARARATAVDAGPAVRTARAAIRTEGRLVTVAGEARPFREATLFAKLSGYVRTLRVDKGDRVRAGELLAVLESPDADQQVIGAQADLAVKRDLAERARGLAPRGIVSQQELDTAEGNLKVAEAVLARARALQEYATLRAPFDAVVTARYVDTGALLPAATGSTSSAQPILQLSDMARLRVEVFLAQEDARVAQVGDAAVVRTDDGQRIEAKIWRITRSLDPRTRTMLAELLVPNEPARIYPGEVVEVDLRLARPPHPAVPAAALILKGDAASVAVLEGGRVRLVPVQVGDHDGRTAEILAGLSGGEEVVLDGAGLLDGATVRPVAAAGPAAPAAAR